MLKQTVIAPLLALSLVGAAEAQPTPAKIVDTYRTASIEDTPAICSPFLIKSAGLYEANLNILLDKKATTQKDINSSTAYIFNIKYRGDVFEVMGKKANPTLSKQAWRESNLDFMTKPQFNELVIFCADKYNGMRQARQIDPQIEAATIAKDQAYMQSRFSTEILNAKRAAAK